MERYITSCVLCALTETATPPVSVTDVPPVTVDCKAITLRFAVSGCTGSLNDRNICPVFMSKTANETKVGLIPSGM